MIIIMKKITLTLIAILCVFLSTFASDINVIKGDKKFFKTASGNALLEFVWEGAQYDNKMALEEHYSDLENLKKVAWNGFVETFNAKSKTVKIVKNAADAKYKMTMKVVNMDSYFKVMGFIPAPATKVWGGFTITDIATGEVLVEINVKEVDGGANPSPDGTFSDCFEELGKQVSKLK